MVIGGSYGGLAATVNLLDLCHGRPAARLSEDMIPEPGSRKGVPIQITIVDERDGYYHLIGSPLALASEEYAPKAWKRFQDIPALNRSEVRYIQGSVVQVNCERKIATIAGTGTATNIRYDESYDYLVASSGLRRAWPVVPQSLERKEYLSETRKHIDKVKYAREAIVVIGGGAVGIEMAAELKLVQPKHSVRLIHSGRQLLSSEPLPDDFKAHTLSVLQESGVEVILGQRVIGTTNVKTSDDTLFYELTLSDGSQILAGQVIKAVSRSVPSSSYLPTSTLDKEGYIIIDPSLNMTGDLPNSKYHFAVGDIVAWSGIRRCGAAMHMGYYAAMNIYQQILSHAFGIIPKFMELQEIPPMIGLAVGKKAVCYSPTSGTSSGEDLMELMFGDDLGYSICWNHLQLSENSHV
ncbi:hypothetical protein AOQ84DRAFT_400144 [Glonium stellatum]|uniref:FAD/NAD(P)-binding domain-containing protein n=1 Tax=Glonium stellatum TaxID=574774 RepID=A0A8E2ET86_9PEZI|nr:hypothetical protein AOQ84DRAFT_400144 [Glonium stellatum]